jgi:hypothetical protein
MKRTFLASITTIISSLSMDALGEAPQPEMGTPEETESKNDSASDRQKSPFVLFRADDNRLFIAAHRSHSSHSSHSSHYSGGGGGYSPSPSYVPPVRTPYNSGGETTYTPRSSSPRQSESPNNDGGAGQRMMTITPTSPTVTRDKPTASPRYDNGDSQGCEIKQSMSDEDIANCRKSADSMKNRENMSLYKHLQNGDCDIKQGSSPSYLDVQCLNERYFVNINTASPEVVKLLLEAKMAQDRGGVKR